MVIGEPRESGVVFEKKVSELHIFMLHSSNTFVFSVLPVQIIKIWFLVH